MSDEHPRPNPIDVHVGARVAAHRKLAGLSQEALGDAIGVTFQQVQKYERGTNRIGASRLFAVAQTLDVPVSVFFAELDGPDETAPSPLTGATRESIELLQAFAAVRDRKLRGHILALVQRLSCHETGADVRE